MAHKKQTIKVQSAKKFTPARKVHIKNNEPGKRIPGGATRPSVLVSPKSYPAIVRRQKVNALLLNHCTDENMRLQAYLHPEDEQILLRIARETIATGTNPALRTKALWALRWYPTTATLSVLTELAQMGEDEYVQASALASLATTGADIALPVLSRALFSPSRLICRAALSGLCTVEKTIGRQKIEAYLASTQDTRTGKNVISALDKIKAKLEIVRKPRKSPMLAKGD